MSVGQQQRVAVARALANRPKLVLADEPTGALDAKNAQQVLDLIRKLCEEVKASLLLVSHDREITAQFPRVVTLAELNRASTSPQSSVPSLPPPHEPFPASSQADAAAQPFDVADDVVGRARRGAGGGDHDLAARGAVAVWAKRVRYELLVGPKGSPLQLTLNTVYQIDKSPGNIPYALYEELTTSPKYRPLVKVAIPYAVGDSYKGQRIIGTLPQLFGHDDAGAKMPADSSVMEYRPGRRYEMGRAASFMRKSSKRSSARK
jgi:hypothetical protein